MLGSFITPCERTGHIQALEEFFDIEYSQDFNHIISSNKPAIIWNYYAYLTPFGRNLKLRHDVWQWYREHQKEAYCMERGGLPDTVYLDAHGFCNESISYYKWPEHKAQSSIDEYLNNLINTESSLEKQSKGRSIETIKSFSVDSKFEKVIFVPLQVRHDTTIIVSSKISVSEFLYQIEVLAQDNPNWLFLIKSHPLDWHNFDETDNIVRADFFHYKDCVAVADAVVCINSGVGLQALAWAKPVYTLGHSYYAQKGLATFSTVASLQRDLEDEHLPNYNSVRQFFSFLVNEFYTECDNITHKFKTPIKLFY